MRYSVVFCHTWYEKNKNSREIELYRGEQVTILIPLYDYDEHTEDDPICIPADYLFDTYAVDNALSQVMHGTMSAAHSDGADEVKFHLELVK